MRGPAVKVSPSVVVQIPQRVNPGGTPPSCKWGAAAGPMETGRSWRPRFGDGSCRLLQEQDRGINTEQRDRKR
ncbi:hypothetical protein NDU88_001230 [Pleurodeles waltl]|uniref:Uncharacterized protein n=1 Tax=Pleurodeles waltl TaxID=8319 RepID=A0AAV7U6M9_PLEWA|nr:hypothetical protein NDU88_001230 [Pleurodeles waltl]